MSEKTYRVMDSATLVRLTQKAAKQRYNKYPSMEFLKRDLDPSGRHLVTFHMLHNDGPEIRTVLMVKVKETMQPVEVALDMDISDFNKLEEVMVEK